MVRSIHSGSHCPYIVISQTYAAHIYLMMQLIAQGCVGIAAKNQTMHVHVSAHPHQSLQCTVHHSMPY